MPAYRWDTLPEDVFWAQVEVEGECWIWPRRIQKNGYGRVTFYSRRVTRRTDLMSHQAAYILAYGEIPEGLFVLHSCDNPPCVRPDHLHLGTARDNMREMYERGRNYRGPYPTTTVCIRGHEREGNTRVSKGGQRHCRPCLAILKRESYHRRQEGAR